MTKKHAELEHLDGNTSIREDSEEIEKYSETIRYWKEGKIGTAFQSYLDQLM